MEERIPSPLPGYPVEIGLALWMLEDARKRTLAEITDCRQEILDWVPPFERNSIATLLYHIPAIELSYLYEDILQKDFPEHVWETFPHPVRNEQGLLFPIEGVLLSKHLERMHIVRDLLLEELKTLTLEDFTRPCELKDYTITPQWALHHLCQHEAEHRGHIQEVRKSAEIKL